jgi:hypothetical protein
LVARRHRYDKVSLCGYLADVYCLGVKNVLGPEIRNELGPRGLGEFRRDFFSGYHGDPLLQYLRQDSELKRAIAVIKTRASNHHPEMRQFDITPNGLILGETVQPR